MTEKKSIKDLFNATAYDNAGEKLGSIKEVFVDDNTGQPTFVEVKHGLFGMSSSLVPLRGHKLVGEDLNLAFSKDRIKDAPELDAERGLTTSEQDKVLNHYGLGSTTDVETYATETQTAPCTETHTTEAAAGTGAVAGAGAAAGHTTHTTETHTAPRTETHTTETREVADRQQAPAAKTDDNSMIRSEEQLNVSKDRVAAGEARLRKYVVNETETVDVPVEREEVRVERTPISAEEAKNYNSNIGEQEASVTLHEDRVNVSKDSVPVEKINLGKEKVQDTHTVSEELRKERIDTDGIEHNVDPKRK